MHRVLKQSEPQSPMPMSSLTEPKSKRKVSFASSFRKSKSPERVYSTIQAEHLTSDNVNSHVERRKIDSCDGYGEHAKPDNFNRNIELRKLDTSDDYPEHNIPIPERYENLNVLTSSDVDSNGNPSNTSFDIDDNENPQRNRNTISKHKWEALQRFKRAASMSFEVDLVENPGSPSKVSTLLNVTKAALKQSKGRPAPTIWTPAPARPHQVYRPVSLSKMVYTGRKIVLTSFQMKSELKVSTHFKIPRCGNIQDIQKYQQHYQIKRIINHVNNNILDNDNYLQVNNNRDQSGRIFSAVELPCDYPILHLSKNVLFEPWKLTASKREKALLSGMDIQQARYDELLKWRPNEYFSKTKYVSAGSKLIKNIIFIGLKTNEYKHVQELESCWMERTGTLHICRKMPMEIDIKSISFLRRIATKSDLENETLFDPPPPAHEFTYGTQDKKDEPIPKNRMPKGFTYIVVIRLAPMAGSYLIKLLEFVYNVKFDGLKGFITVYSQNDPDNTYDRPRSSQQGSLQSPASPRLFCRQNTL